jgi:sirohydrochlorin cobaltochelatase
MAISDQAASDFDGVLLVGHGTRDPAGLAEFWQLVGRVREQRPDWLVEGCFLELAEPSIAAGLANLAQKGVRRVRAVPLVLFAAGHAKRDIPQALAAAAQEHPVIAVELSPHLGCHDTIVELSERRFRAALGDQVVAPTSDTLLLLVGRGSNDPQATREMQQFAAYRSARMPAVPLRIAFIAMAEPRLDQALELAAESPQPRCVIQPHLLFTGLLLAELRAKIDGIARQVPEKEWIVIDHIGPDIRLATAVIEIAGRKIGGLGGQSSEPNRRALRLEG